MYIIETGACRDATRERRQLAVIIYVIVEEAARLLTRSPAKHCPLDPVPTWLLKRAAEQFVPILDRSCNASFQAGNLPLSQKHALVSARLKKSTLDPADLNSYRPISQLPFASKLVERSAASRFVHHCDEHGLLPARQSAYRRYRSTETAVVIVYNDTVRSIARGEVVPHVLLDLSSACDTVDHDLPDVHPQGPLILLLVSRCPGPSRIYQVGR